MGVLSGLWPRSLLWPSRMVSLSWPYTTQIIPHCLNIPLRATPRQSSANLDGVSGRFNLFHESTYGDSPESAKIRYGNEVKRIAGVLDTALAKSAWLVGDKCTYADLAFTMWNMQIAFFMAGRTGEHAWDANAFPHFTRWQDACLARESVRKVVGVLGERDVRSC